MTSPLDQHNAEMAACLARRRRIEHPELEYLPIIACMARAPRSDDDCTFEDGHEGPHSWEKGCRRQQS